MTPRHARARWPDPEIPGGSPEWLLYEFDDDADAVIRTVEIFPDGRVTRNSIEIEERNGVACPSLIDCSLTDGFAGVALEEVEPSDFQRAWDAGADTPFWNVR